MKKADLVSHAIGRALYILFTIITQCFLYIDFLTLMVLPDDTDIDCQSGQEDIEMIEKDINMSENNTISSSTSSDGDKLWMYFFLIAAIVLMATIGSYFILTFNSGE